MALDTEDLEDVAEYDLKDSKVRKFCKRICALYKARKTKDSGRYYDQGFKRCVECEIFIDCNGIRCPCCDHILRVRPHNNISKARLTKSLFYAS
jgi:hypothetical protein